MNRAEGALLGLACGDALGATAEFMEPGDFQVISEMIGGGVFHLQPGQWTDDTSMALCLADSLIERLEFDPIDQLNKYVRWYRQGYRSSTGSAFDIGDTTCQALNKFEITGGSYPGITGRWSAGNGSIMRAAPVPIFFLRAPETELIKYAALSSMTTHAEPVCLEACQFMALWIQRAIRGASKTELLNGAEILLIIESNNDRPMHKDLRKVICESYSKSSIDPVSSGYVVDTLRVALWALATTENFEDGMIKTINLGGDADTAGAVYGQLAGAIYGKHKIPLRWRRKVYQMSEITEVATILYDLGLRQHETSP